MVGFVVLHYQNIEVTKLCMEYLLKLKGIENNLIVIVDNASPNGSGNDLLEMYTSNEVVKVIINNENLGFAKGNNIGFRYAQEHNCNNIVVMNSDVYITDECFIDKLTEIQEGDSELTVIAPDIVNKDGIHCNPMSIPPINIKGIKKIRRDSRIRYFLYSIPFVNSYLYKRAIKIGDAYFKTNKPNYECLIKDIVPDGSCIIYMNHWCKSEEFAFVPITFMYAEEHILYEYLHSKGYSCAYFPIISVNHMEGQTTKNEYSGYDKKGINKRKKYYQWHIDACNIYIEYKKKISRNG